MSLRPCIVTCTPVPFVQSVDGKSMLAPITTQWHRKRMSLNFPTNIITVSLIVDGMEVDDARNEAVKSLLKMSPEPEFLFFLDYDVLAEHDAVTKLVAQARFNPDYDIFAGVYCCKGHNPPDPLIYAEDGQGPYWDWAVGDILKDGRIKSVHMGLTLIRTSLFKKMIPYLEQPETWFKTIFGEYTKNKKNGHLETKAGTEDIYFCQLANKAGAKILVDTSVLAGHICHRTGIIYGLTESCKPVQKARWMLEGLSNNEEIKQKYECEKKALDLGAGTYKRNWDGYTTFTSDIRHDIGVDYVMDSRQLNLPSDHFDLTASSHHLEHIGRWDQELVWAQIFRVTKPGGLTEHVVPNIAWAAAKIVEGMMDEHVMNVLYGGQEAMGYAKEFNVHYFGYTKYIGKALAEKAGFVDVEVKDWHDDPKLVYNLIITGKKPDYDYEDEILTTEYIHGCPEDSNE